MQHGAYQAEIRYSAETDRFHGCVVNTVPGDLVLFEGTSVAELHADFAGQIEFYESVLRRAGREPAVAR